jgi:hypothetical protein
MDTGGGSMVAIGVEAPLSEDEGFLKWCTQKLDGCLGAKSVRPGLAAQAGQNNMMAAANMVNQMGRTVLSRFQALAPVLAARQEGGGGTRDGATSVGGFGKVYTTANVAQLMGYCGVNQARDIPHIWGMFQQTKEYNTYRHELEMVMTAWSRREGIEIDKGMYLDNAPLESIAKLQFNPAGTGAGVALWESADKGLSIHICRPKCWGGWSG